MRGMRGSTSMAGRPWRARITAVLSGGGGAGSMCQLRHKFDSSDVTKLSPITVTIDSALTKLIRLWAQRPIAGINRRACGQQPNVSSASCAVDHKRT